MKSSTDTPRQRHGRSQRLTISAGLASVVVSAMLVALKLWALAETGALSIAASLADSAHRPDDVARGCGGDRLRRAPGG